MNLNQIEAFVRIADNHSFSQTAKEMFLTQPTVSSGINNLEEELGTRLFTRTAGRVELTENGERIYIYARQIVEGADTLKKILREDCEPESSYPVLIAASTIPAQYILPSVLGEYHKRWPGTRFQLREMDSLAVISELESGKADIGFCGTAGDNTLCDYVPVAEDELVIVTPVEKRYQKIAESQDSVEWICRESIILREDGSGTRRETMKQLKKYGISMEDLQVIAMISSPFAILQAVKSGVGITIISRLAAAADIEAGNVLAFPLASGGYHRKFYMVRNAKMPMNSAIRRLQRLMTELES